MKKSSKSPWISRPAWMLLALLVASPLAAAGEESAAWPDPMAITGKNLLQNPGAEDGTLQSGGLVTLPGWTTTGKFTGAMYGSSNLDMRTEATRIGGGTACFFGGGESTYDATTAIQVVSVSADATAIDAGQRSAVFSAYLATVSGYTASTAFARAEFLSATGGPLGTMALPPIIPKDWNIYIKEDAAAQVPAGTRSVRITLTSIVTGDRSSGNKGVIDNVYFGLEVSARDTTMLLSKGRIAITVSWRNQYDGSTGSGYILPQDDTYGFFFFSIPSNPEVFVKVLDFGSGKALCFVGGLSDFYYKVTFTCLRTGKTLVFEKPASDLKGFANGTDLDF